MKHSSNVRPSIAGLVLALSLVFGHSGEAATIGPGVDLARNGGAPQRVIIHSAPTAALDEAISSKRDPSAPEHRRAVRDAVDRLVAELEPLTSTGELVVDRGFVLQPAIAARATGAALRSIAERGDISLIEIDRRWSPQTYEGLQVIGADVLHQTGVAGEGTAIAIVDSGVDYLHPTLGGGQIPNAKVVFGTDIADGDADAMDCSGHGTAVASVAAGSSYQWSPSRRFAGGVAPAAKILAYKVTSDLECNIAYTSAVVAAIEDAVLRRDGEDYRVAAINISLGNGEYTGPCDTDNAAYSAAVTAARLAGITVVTASGNNGYTDAINAPACLTGALAVGSVWDADPGLLPFIFCLDSACDVSCDDSFKYRRSVSCYSNSSPYLDLLAPSEFLKAASAGGVTVDFGGTSGASAYLAGAVALLAEALPSPSPATISFLLAATGAPVMDEKNGLVRSAIDLEAALAAATGVDASVPVALPVPSTGDSQTTSVLSVDLDGPVGSLAVLVDLTHPEPENLRIELVAPDGTSVLLHDRTEGPGGIVGTYPGDLDPVESLGRFAGVPARGAWSLEVSDTGTAVTGVSPNSTLAWALKVDSPSVPVEADTTMIFPVVAHVDGAMGTQWRSDLRIFNPIHRQSTEVRLHLLPPSDAAKSAPRQTDVVVPHGSVVALDDIVLDRFGLDDAQGTVLVHDPTGTMVHGTSRTFTESETGTYGQFVAPEVSGADSTGAGEPSLIVLPTAGPDHRVNIGMTEITGETATVAMTLIDSDTGIALGASKFFELDGFSNLQVNGILPSAEAGADPDPYVALTVVRGEGRITAYGSVIDNQSGDAVFVDGAAPRVVPRLLIPVVARNQGHSGTEWRSDLRVLNHSAFSVHVDAELRFQGSIGVPPVTRTFELQPGQARTIEDVVGSLFGSDDAVGSLLLTPREGPAALCATSRTANHGGDTGTYGQYVPGVATGDGLRGRGVLLHVDRDAHTRTNLGVVETDGLSVGVRIRLVGPRGDALGVESRMTLGAWESIQLNDVFAALGADPERNARIEITRDSGDGAFFAYASVVDADSGDAIFVPVRPIEPAP